MDSTLDMASVRKSAQFISAACLWATLAPSAVAGQDLQASCNSWLQRADIKYSKIGLEVMEMPGGKILYDNNGMKRFTPASTAKVLTTSCAYDLFGPDYTFSTKLSTTGSVVGNVLKGDLYVEASQDPTLSRDDLNRLIGDLASTSHIAEIDGKVILTYPAEGRENFVVSWLAEDFGQDWMPVSSSLVVDRNIAFSSGFPKHLRAIEPRVHNLSILDSLISSGIGSSWIALDGATNVLSVSRGMAFGASGKPDSSIKREGPFVVANPDVYNLALIHDALINNHIKCSNPVILPNALAGKENRTVLAEHKSKPLAQIVRYCLYESDNLYAQQLLRLIGIGPAGEAGATSGRVSRRLEYTSLEERGLNRLGEWLSSVGVPGREVVLFDGCGLSRKDCLTPHALNLVLRHMALTKQDNGYLELLKASGDKGSVFRFKTGAMDTVRGISGLLTNNYGQTSAVTVLINGHTPSVKELRMAIADLIERLRQAPLPKPKGPGKGEGDPAAAMAATVPQADKESKAAPANSVHKRHRHRR
jgi:D-alanyl-D-alanine carboxypeptidase/D-alanyl-D-alanine-endopeptidase (penicillin-binding protein 4)